MMFRIKRMFWRTIPLASGLLLTSCMQPQSPLMGFLEDSGHENPVVNLADVYGDQWDEFALVCAGASDRDIAEALRLPAGEVPHLKDSERSGFVFWDDSTVESDLLNPSDVMLCTERTPLASTLTVSALSFSQGVDNAWRVDSSTIS